MDITNPKTRTSSEIFFSKRELAFAAVGAFGFFIGRASVFSYVNPLCVAFTATFIGAGYSLYPTALLVSLGVATRLRELLFARYILSVALLCAYQFASVRLFPLLNWNHILRKPYTQAIAASVSTLIAGVAAAVLYGNSAYLYLVALIEAALSGSLTLVIKRATVILTVRRRRANLIGSEDMIALAAVMAGVIAGAADIQVGGVPLRFPLCLYVLFVVAFKGGAAMGAACGMLLGFFLHMGGYWDVSLCVVWGLCGMTGGFLKRFGRIPVMAGAAAAGAAALFLLARPAMEFYLVYALIGAGLAFMLTPQSFYFNVAAALSPVMDAADDYMDKIKEETTRRLDSFAAAFDKLAGTFSGLSAQKSSFNKNDITRLIDDLAARACGDCDRRERCWEDDFYQTYQHVFSMLDTVEKHSGPYTMPDAFRDNCERPEIFLRELNAIFTQYKTDLRWNNRLAESRELVSQQLYGVSGIIKRLSEEIDLSLKFHEGLEEEMITALLKNKIEVNSVIVLENKSGKYQVTVSHKPCFNKKLCVNEILPVLNAVLKRRMRPESTHCDTKNGLCAARFAEDQKLRVTSGVARRAKNKRDGSGDSYTFMELKNGQCLLALSDGMGSGERARRESSATVELLEDFIDSGFDKELAVRMINSVLVLKSSEESFSTLDICYVDLYTGDAEFIKIGAASTFLLRNGKVTVIRSSSLPMGMLNEVDLEVSARKLTHDDIVLMVTDGVTEAVSSYEDKEGWLTETLRGCRFHNPQDVADYILGEAERAASGGPRDDMTVLAARIWERT